MVVLLTTFEAFTSVLRLHFVQLDQNFSLEEGVAPDLEDLLNEEVTDVVHQVGVVALDPTAKTKRISVIVFRRTLSFLI